MNNLLNFKTGLIQIQNNSEFMTFLPNLINKPYTKTLITSLKPLYISKNGYFLLFKTNLHYFQYLWNKVELNGIKCLFIT